MSDEELAMLEWEFNEVPQRWGKDAIALVRAYRKLRDAMADLGIELVDDGE